MQGSEVISGVVAVALLACGGSQREPVAPEPAGPADAGQEELAVGLCGPHGMLGMYAPAHGTYVKGHPATAAASEEFGLAAAAIAEYDYLDAARHYLACAQQLRRVPVGHDQEGTAILNAQVCYYNAIHAYASAGRFQADGRAALTDAADADPRLSSYIAEQLADPPMDCAVTAPPP